MNRSRRWWARRSERTRAILTYVLPLVGFALAVGLVWLWHHHTGTATRREGQRLSLRVGLVLALSALSLLTGQRRWNFRAIGLLGLLLSLAGLFVRIGGQWGPQPPAEWESDLYQSFLNVGSIALFIGILALNIARLMGRDIEGDGKT